MTLFSIRANSLCESLDLSLTADNKILSLAADSGLSVDEVGIKLTAPGLFSIHELMTVNHALY